MTATSVTADPAPSAGELRDRVRDASARGRALRIVAGGSWLDANRPVYAEEVLALGAHAGIVEYEPGDLTLTARAGTTLDEITRITAPNGQWLTLDPYGDPRRATIGATIATASYGPLAHQFGTPRDVTLGVEFVSGAGDIVRGGGRVVKNVAGFDLTRLLTGSWGTLGVLTEATLRLRAQPRVQSTFALSIRGGETEMERIRAALRALPFVPLAAQIVDGNAARALGVGDRSPTLLVRLGGNAEALHAHRDQLSALSATEEIGGEFWRRLQSLEPARAVVFRASQLPSAFTATWRDAVRVAERWPDGYCHGDPGRGVVRIVLPLTEQMNEPSLPTLLALPFEGTRIYERLPASLWASRAAPAIRGQLDRGIKAAFDPQNVLNPGIFGETQ